MAFSLYDATVANYLQILGATEALMAKCLAHFNEKGVALATIVESKLAEDMRPFRFQVVSLAHHSRGAMAGVRDGVFVPPSAGTDLDYAALQALVAEARRELAGLTREAVDGLLGREVIFKLGERSMPFTAEGFLMSFSLPNFFFHATTAYDILRHNGAPIGKRDFIGQLKLKA
jgi:uncharacterized protein